MRESDGDCCAQTVTEWWAWLQSAHAHAFVHKVSGMVQHGYIDAEISGRQLEQLDCAAAFGFPHSGKGTTGGVGRVGGIEAKMRVHHQNTVSAL